MASFRHERSTCTSSEIPSTKILPDRLDIFLSQGKSLLQMLEYTWNNITSRTRMLENKLLQAKKSALYPQDWLELNKDIGHLRQLNSSLLEQISLLSDWTNENSGIGEKTFFHTAQKAITKRKEQSNFLQKTIDTQSKVLNDLQKQLVH